MLRRHEGLRLQFYVDTVGKPTIGYGRNLDGGAGIDVFEAEFLMDNDINRVFASCTKNIPGFIALDNIRQAVLVDMGYNMGMPSLLLFKRMIAAIKRKDFEAAAMEMLNSKWARQVPLRAAEDAVLMRTGLEIIPPKVVV